MDCCPATPGDATPIGTKELTVREGEPLPHPRQDELILGAVLHALSDPVRLQIVCRLAEANLELACGTFDLPVTKSTSTYHFKELREAGIIVQRDEGTRRLSRLRRADLEARFPGLLDTVLNAAKQRETQAAGHH